MFEFLDEQFPKLSDYGHKAEKCVNDDPNLCLLNLGRIAETITEILCRENNIPDTPEKFSELKERDAISEEIFRKISALIETKNDAANDGYSSEMSSSRLITTAEELCRWFMIEKSEGSFDFLADLFPPDKPVPVLMNLAELGREAEANLYTNTRYCLICLGDLGEAAADKFISDNNIETHEKEQIERIDLLYEEHKIDDKTKDILHTLRMTRNKVLHERYNEEYNSVSTAKRLIKDALSVCQWLLKLNMKPGYVVKARITGEDETGYSASIGRIPAHVAYNEVPDGKTCEVGKKYVFKIMDTVSQNVELSLSAAQNDYNLSLSKLYAKYKIGQDVKVTIKSLSNLTGAIVELKDGLEARIPPSELSCLYDFKAGEKMVRYETTARVKYFNLTQYPPMILSVRDIRDVKDVKEGTLRKNEPQKTAMTDLDFRLFCRFATFEKMVEALDEGANPNATNNNNTTALMMAAQYNKNARVVKALIDAGARLDEQNHKGNTALMYAAMSNTPDVVRAIYDAAADIEIKNNEGKKAADYAAVNKKLNGSDIVRLLRDKVGQTDFHRAADGKFTPAEYEDETAYYEYEPEEDTPEDEGALLELRAKLQKDFLKICRSGTEDEIAEAVSAGVNVNVANKSSATALMFAAQSNTAQAIEILIHAGASLNAQDSNGNTALIYAASYNHDDVVETLIDAGADRDVRNLEGLKASDYALGNYRLVDTEAVKRL
ncbi:MAG: ankyrin repeat domain-containing protein [Synergistaceae bacterium]|nr:ankyrin repeat domain-containing protein [Synergistaceae bacterium]